MSSSASSGTLNVEIPTSEFRLVSEPLPAGQSTVESFRFEDGIIDRSHTLLLLPGHACTGQCFARQRPLAAEWDLRSLTLPERHGPAAGAIEDFAGVVGAAAARFDRPVLLGTSFSGLVAIDAVSRMPDLFSGVILVSTFTPWASSAMVRTIAAALFPVGELISRMSGRLGTSFAGGTQLDTIAAAELRRETRCFSVRERRRRVRAAIRADLRAQASTIRVPSLLIHGTGDRLVPRSAARELGHLLEEVEVHEMPGAGHLPYLTHSSTFNQIVGSFLRRVLGARDLRSMA